MQFVIVGENDGDKFARAMRELLSRKNGPDVWLFPDGDDTDLAFEDTFIRPLVLITCPNSGQMCGRSEAAAHYFSSVDPELTVWLWTMKYGGWPLMMPTAHSNDKKGVVLKVRVENVSPYGVVSVVAPLVIPVIAPARQPTLAL